MERTFQGYADPAFERELSRFMPHDQDLVRQALAELALDPLGRPSVTVMEGSRWPGTVRVRAGRFRVLALVLPKARVILFTTVFRKKRRSDYDAAIRRHDARVSAQGPPISEFLR